MVLILLRPALAREVMAATVKENQCDMFAEAMPNWTCYAGSMHCQVLAWPLWKFREFRQSTHRQF